jgi:hypothetical protein
LRLRVDIDPYGNLITERSWADVLLSTPTIASLAFIAICMISGFWLLLKRRLQGFGAGENACELAPPSGRSGNSKLTYGCGDRLD